MTLTQNHYGKSRVRLARVIRNQDRHDIHEMTVSIRLEGDFEASYAEGDNRLVLPTDTMKNTVYALARDPAVAHPESFALLLARHFVKEQPQVSRARVGIHSQPWQRHGRYSFVSGGDYRRFTRADVPRDPGKIGEKVEAGVTGYMLLKTTGSAFQGYVKDRYTTLPETADRMMATSLTAVWQYQGSDISWETSWHAVMKLLTDTFAAHESKSVQHTLYAMAETVLGECGQISRIRLRMPNKHYLRVDLAPFGLENRNEIFCPTSEPHGLIEAVLER